MAEGTWRLIPFLRIATPSSHRGNSQRPGKHKKLLQQQKKAGQRKEEILANFWLTPYLHIAFFFF